MSETKEYYAKGWSHFIDCINFDSSAFDSEAIEFMNEFPRHIMDFLDSHNALLAACETAEHWLIGNVPAVLRPASLNKLLMDAIELAQKEG